MKNYKFRTISISAIILVLGVMPLGAVLSAGINIVDIQHEMVDERVVKITWRTDRPSSGKVEFGETRDYLPYFVVDNRPSATYHEVEIGNLKGDTTYYFQVVAQSNTETVVSFTYSFETEEIEDIRAPRISGLRVAYVSGTKAALSWQTDERANSWVNYSTDLSYNMTAGSRAQVTDHLVILHNLRPGFDYRVRVYSVDEDDNNSGYSYEDFRTDGTDAEDREELLITRLRPSSPGDEQIGGREVAVSFRTNHLAKGRVTLKGPGHDTHSHELDYGTDHRVSFLSLDPNTEYRVYVAMNDIFRKSKNIDFKISTKDAGTRASGTQTAGTSNTSLVEADAVLNPGAAQPISCSAAIFSNPGFMAFYYEMTENLKYPLSQDPVQTGWFIDENISRTTIDRSLNFGRDFAGRGRTGSNQPNHFNAYWRAIMVAPGTGAYSYTMKSDDNAWVYIDGRLSYAQHAKEIEMRNPKEFDLEAGLHTIEIFFSHRGRSGSQFEFNPEGGLSFYAWPSSCSLAAISGFTPGWVYSAGSNYINGSGSGNNGSGSGGDDSAVRVLGAEYSRYTPSEGLIRVQGQPDVYTIMNGQTHLVSSPASFNRYGYNWGDIRLVSQAEFDSYPRARLIKSPDSPAIYFLYKRPENKWLKIVLNSPTVFVSYPENFWGNVITVTKLDIDSYPDVRLVKTADDPGVYYLQNDVLRPVSAQVFAAKGYNRHEIVIVNQVHLDSYRIGDDWQ